MRKQDMEVREVVCSETGKPMAKIPLWMADIKVKFVCDEARQKNPPAPGLLDVETVRKSAVVSTDLDELKESDAVGAVMEEDEDLDNSFDEAEADVEETVEEDFEEA
jgi:hypothetical protein